MQIKFAANLLSSGFPLWTASQSRTVLIGRTDQNKINTGNSEQNPNIMEREDGSPEALYMHNVLPTNMGYKSANYQQIIAPVEGILFVDIVTVRNERDQISFLAISDIGRAYLYNTTALEWVDVTVTGGVIANLTTAFVSGRTYVCFDSFGVFSVNFEDYTLEQVDLVGIDTTKIIGIAQAYNYMLLHDGETVYWSAALDPLDFVPSLTTGAGSGIPTSLKGKIVHIGELALGYAVYSTTNIVLAAYSGNIRYPWIFKEAPNSAGIRSPNDVSINGDDGSNYAWTSAGLLQVSNIGSETKFPEISDFLSGRVFEDFNEATNTLSYQYLTGHLKVQLHFSSSRYIVISYGINNFTHAIVYDVLLRRAGKLKLNHIKAFEAIININLEPPTYNDMQSLTYNDMGAMTYANLVVPKNIAAEPKRLMGFLASDGSVVVLNLDYGSFEDSGVIIFGKYQLTRQALMTLHEIDVESIDVDNENFSLHVLSSSDGKTMGTAAAPYLHINNNFIKSYLMRTTAINHSLLFKGSFNLVSLVMTATQHGRR